MIFTRSEKVACVYALMCLAQSDGPLNEKETCQLAESDNAFGITTEEALNGLTFEATKCMPKDAFQIIRLMSIDKKVILENEMVKIMKLDEINDNKLGMWWTIQIECNLPEWIKRNLENLRENILKQAGLNK